MKGIMAAAAIFAATLATPALATDVGVSISIGQPGFYGRLDLGDFPAPQVIDPLPIIIERGVPERPPIYLRVPAKHIKKWKKYCRKYNACGERVIFVQDEWYHREYVPRYQERHRHLREERRERREERREEVRERHQERHHDRDHR